MHMLVCTCMRLQQSPRQLASYTASSASRLSLPRRLEAHARVRPPAALPRPAPRPPDRCHGQVCGGHAGQGVRHQPALQPGAVVPGGGGRGRRLPCSQHAVLTGARKRQVVPTSHSAAASCPPPLATTLQDAGPDTPIFVFLSPGVDVAGSVEALGRKLGFTAENGKYFSVSLGQGQVRAGG